MLAALAFTSLAVARDDELISRGKQLSEQCVACHAADGNSSVPVWPKIAGLGVAYMYKQLNDFKQGMDGPRPNAVMYGIVEDLSAQDMQDLAEYYASQKMLPGVAQADKANLGAQIYRVGNKATGVAACAACHGPNGRGYNLAKFPRLSGQHSEYIAQQLLAFKNGERSNSANQIMQEVAKRLTDEEIEAVSSYVSGLY